MTTNGTLLDQEFLEWAHANRVKLMVSIDSPRDCHDRYRSGGRRGARYDEIVARLRGYERDTIVVTTITRQTPSFRAALQPLLDVGFKRVSFNLVHTEDPQLALGSDDARRFVAEFVADREWFGMQASRIGNLSQVHDSLDRLELRRRPCAAGRTMYALGPDGKAYFCHGCVGNPEFEVTSECEPISSWLRAKLNDDLPNDPCHSCWARNLCGRDCWLVRWQYGEDHRQTRCEIIRGLIWLALATYQRRDEAPFGH